MTAALRRTALAVIAVLSAPGGGSASVAHATAWPQRPVRVVVPAPAGSSLDLVARLLGEPLSAAWQQPVVVDNRPGAGGQIGIEVAARAAGDGHVLALGFNGPLAYAPFLYPHLPYDVRRDLRPVVLTSRQPNVLAVHAGVPARAVGELATWARTAGRVTYASVGAGSASHLAMVLFARHAGFAATHVPYAGSPAAALSVARGETQLLFAVASGVQPQARAGQLRLLATTGARRFPGLETLPTLAESGYPAVVSEAWNGLVASAATPGALVARINADVDRVLNTPAGAARLRELGMAPGRGSPADFGRLIEDEMKRWGPVIREAGVTAD